VGGITYLQLVSSVNKVHLSINLSLFMSHCGTLRFFLNSISFKFFLENECPFALVNCTFSIFNWLWFV